ncbi:LuxR C-terminal-related transcriptional regulator [Actinopolymorpha sp. B17G11]|uniref:ATP-binding protein n=1 Tax=Actinopolymorpha sp. B17G11 TaxID=3160861 RepID=UPI0032E37165
MPPIDRGFANLPPEFTNFVGRRHELTDVRRLLASSRLVTLTGRGGVGKTRLALRVATNVRRAFGDGVWLVELDRLQDPELLAETVTVALGLREPFEGPPMTVLEHYLASRQLLLVMDNCEHLVDAVAKLVATLLRSCPELRVLATSREPLSTYGEVTLPVPSLPLPDEQLPASPQELFRIEAVALFVDRATAVAPGFALTRDNQAAVAEICRRLDGLPLAIELAAARLRVLRPQEIADRLKDRFRLLDKGPRGAPTRQQTLLSCIEWSYDLCSTQEQLLWTRLAVFAGGFDLDAAESITAGEDLVADVVLEVVASLVDKSIVIREGDAKLARYRLLDTIREFGRVKLQETGEFSALRRRHRDWYAQLVERADTEWVGPRQVDWLTLLDREQPNIRAALEFALSERADARTALRMAATLYSYWIARGPLSEGRRWLDQALACPVEISSDRVRALYACSMLAGHQGDFPVESARADEGGDVARKLGDPSMSALINLANGYLAHWNGDLARGPVLLGAALDVFRADNNLRGLLEALFALSLMSIQHDPKRALACQREMLAITEPRNEVWFRSLALWSLGLTTWLQGEARQAVDLVRGSLRLKRSIGDLLGIAWCLEALAWIAASENDHDPQHAATLLGSAKNLMEAIGTSPSIGQFTLPYHGECERRTRLELGGEAFDAALQDGRDLGLPAALAYALGESVRTTPEPAAIEAILTPREREVAELIAQGSSNKDIARHLVISQRTAEAHVEHILVKFGFTSRAQIAARVVEGNELG